MDHVGCQTKQQFHIEMTLNYLYLDLVTLILKLDFGIMKMYAYKVRSGNLFGNSVSESSLYLKLTLDILFGSLGLHSYTGSQVPRVLLQWKFGSNTPKARPIVLLWNTSSTLWATYSENRHDRSDRYFMNCSSTVDATPSLSAHALVLRHVLILVSIVRKDCKLLFLYFRQTSLFPWQCIQTQCTSRWHGVLVKIDR